MSAPLAMLREYRRRAAPFAPAAAREPLPALFVICAECGPATAFVTAADPALVLQNLGGVVPPTRAPDDMDTETFTYALTVSRVRHVVLCGHAACGAPAPERRAAPLVEVGGAASDRRFSPAARASQASLLLQRERAAARALALGVTVRLHALWFDEHEGDVYAYRADERRFMLLSDLDVERFLAELAGADPARDVSIALPWAR